MRFIITLALSALLFGCATSDKYENRINSWVGKTENQLLAHWGEPQERRPDTGGREIFIYETTDTKQRMKVNTTTESRGGGSITNNQDLSAKASYGTVRHLRCTTAFLVSSKGIVENAKAGGNSCRSR